jgi:hypothetical protein
MRPNTRSTSSGWCPRRRGPTASGTPRASRRRAPRGRAGRRGPVAAFALHDRSPTLYWNIAGAFGASASERTTRPGPAGRPAPACGSTTTSRARGRTRSSLTTRGQPTPRPQRPRSAGELGALVPALTPAAGVSIPRAPRSAASGALVASFRSGRPGPSDLAADKWRGLVTATSLDDGASWSWPKVRSLVHFIPDSRTYSVPRSLNRRRDNASKVHSLYAHVHSSVLRLPDGRLVLTYAARLGASGHGRSCHSTLPLAVDDCHSLGMYTVISLPFSVKLTAPPTARRDRRPSLPRPRGRPQLRPRRDLGLGAPLRGLPWHGRLD